VTSQPYEIDLTRTVRRALAERLPLDVVIGASEFINGSSADNPHRAGKELGRPYLLIRCIDNGRYAVLGGGAGCQPPLRLTHDHRESRGSGREQWGGGEFSPSASPPRLHALSCVDTGREGNSGFPRIPKNPDFGEDDIGTRVPLRGVDRYAGHVG
jgi:hypothetical protein